MALKKISENKYVFTIKGRNAIFRTTIYKIKNKCKPYVLLLQNGVKTFRTQVEIIKYFKDYYRG